ncbi:MAG: GTP 3',8-cyclase MoaA [Gammaproteobacteria bacterium]
MTTSTHTNKPVLVDSFDRRIEYVRLSLTDKCNLRCFYCMPKGFKNFEQPEHWLTFDEIERVIKAFTELGVARVRLTGGEPLVRKNITQLSKRLTALPGLDDLSLSTNAVLLEKHASDLHDAGISRINVSLDSLKPERFKTITGGELQPVIDGLMAAKKAGFFPIKINMVAMKGINDDELEDMVEFCIKHDFTLRFIETMPMGATGKDATDHYLDLQEVKQKLSKIYDLIPGVMPGGGPARYVQIKNTNLRIGFITPISQHFCETCNRVRISVDGTLYLCLGQDDKVELRPLLRDGISDEKLKNVLIDAIGLKPEKHEFKNKPEQVVRLMSMTGG